MEVSKLLLSSHPTTCPLDPIPSHLLQAISPTLLPALTHIINTSLLTGIFPIAFKQARVAPLLKKPILNTSLIENYRPVSLLPFIDKTLERVVFNQVSLFLSQNNKLDAKQSGFRSGHSTETALLSVTEALRIAKADSKSSVLILLDLSAAFDTVNHQILLSTLSSLDITGIPLCWFESYLTGRSFKVAWGGEVSKAHQLVTGVPQGSVLGPLLFSTYTTSLGPIIQAHGFSYRFYADDTQLYLSFRPDDPTVAARISSCLADISAWMKEHHLQLNLAKTELFVFPATPTLQHDFTIQLGSSTITPSASVRNLGVIFDDQLTFKEHIAKTARSCIFVYVVEMSLPCSFMITKCFIILELLKTPCLEDMGWETIRLWALLPSRQIYRRFYADPHALFLIRSVGDDGGGAMISWLDSRLTWRPYPMMDVTSLLLAGAGALPGGGGSRRRFRWRPWMPRQLSEFISLLPSVRWK